MSSSRRRLVRTLSPFESTAAAIHAATTSQAVIVTDVPAPSDPVHRRLGYDPVAPPQLLVEAFQYRSRSALPLVHRPSSSRIQRVCWGQSGSNNCGVMFGGRMIRDVYRQLAPLVALNDISYPIGDNHKSNPQYFGQHGCLITSCPFSRGHYSPQHRLLGCGWKLTCCSSPGPWAV